MDLCDVGLYGLGVLGQNFALNMASNGFKVCIGNSSFKEVDESVQRAKDEGNLPLIGAYSIPEFVSRISIPRKIIVSVMADEAVDVVVEKLSEHMEPGDLLVDAGNEWYKKSIRRCEVLEQKGILFMEIGISGGEQEFRNGPCLMPGGTKEAFDLMEPILMKCAAQVAEKPCTTYLGPVGSGNYVKMILNGIEYAEMQLISEAYDILKNVVEMSNEDMSKKFASWNEGDLSSRLIDITSKILSKTDDVTGEGYVVDNILDVSDLNEIDKRTIQESTEYNIPAPTIASAFDVLFLSVKKEERVRASALLEIPRDISYCPKEQLVEDLQYAIYASKICGFSQGMSVMKAASDEHGWNINLSECARIWKGGCSVRGKILDKIQEAFASDPNLPTLLLDQKFADELKRKQFAWRRIVTLCVAYGVACPAFCASLGYYDTYRRDSLPANLTQAQRNFFGGHSYQRTDREGFFSCQWTGKQKKIVE